MSNHRPARHRTASPTATSEALIVAAGELSERVERLRFQRPVTHVYNPLTYAWPAHAEYLRRFGRGRKRAVFLGMNPGPFGMSQTGVPFGEVSAVRDWMGLRARIGKPPREHPKRPVLGFDCPRSEVSGRRLWGLFAERFGSAADFFADFLVVNYCPLTFLAASGRNLTPDKLRSAEQTKLFAACDEHLRCALEVLQPAWLIGVGDFAARRARLAAEGTAIQIGQILHPSPANPTANRGWAKVVTRQLEELGLKL